MDQRTPRDGRVLEELGTYDPKVGSVHARAVLNGERIKYWLSVGAQPTEKVRVLIRKYGADGTHLSQQKVALEHIRQPRPIPDPGPPATRAAKPKSPQEQTTQEAAADANAMQRAEPQTETPAPQAEMPAESESSRTEGSSSAPAGEETAE
jgi:small subunit ribosomal protein S16